MVGIKNFEIQNFFHDSLSNILLIGDSLISNITRYEDVWSEYFSKYNALNFGIPGDAIQNLLWRIKNLKFPSNSTLSCIFILCGTDNMDHNSAEDVIRGFISSGISVQRQCHCAKVLIIQLLPRDKKFSLRRRNINIINPILESECLKYNLYTYNHELEWLNADGSLNESLFIVITYIWLKRGMNSWQKKLWLFTNI